MRKYATLGAGGLVSARLQAALYIARKKKRAQANNPVTDLTRTASGLVTIHSLALPWTPLLSRDLTEKVVIGE